MWSLSMMKLNIIVSSVTIRQVAETAFNIMWSLSMRQLNIVLSFVNLKQVQKAPL